MIRYVPKFIHPPLVLNKSSGKHVNEMYTPNTLFLYSKTGVYRGISIFSSLKLLSSQCDHIRWS